MTRIYKDVFYKIETEDGVYYGYQQTWEDPDADILRDVWSGESGIKEIFTGAPIKIYNQGPRVPNSEYSLIKMYIGEALYYVGEYHEICEFPTEYRNMKYHVVKADEIEYEIESRYSSREEAIKDVRERLSNRTRILREQENEKRVIESRKAYERKQTEERTASAAERLKKLMK